MIRPLLLFLILSSLFSCAVSQNSYEKNDELVVQELATLGLMATITNIEINPYLSGSWYLITVEFGNINDFGRSEPSKSSLNFMLDYGKEQNLKIGDQIRIDAKLFEQ